MSDIRVLLLYSARFVPPEAMAFIETTVPARVRWQAVEQQAPAATRLAAFAEADYVFAYPGDPTAGELSAARNLKLFQLLSAGHDWLDLSLFAQHGIPVASNDGSNAVSTAEHAVLLMLALLKQLPEHHSSLAAGEWRGMSSAMQMRELRGKVVGLVGFGEIARHVARRVRAFDASVIYTKPTRAPLDVEQSIGASFRSLDDLLGESDIVSLHAPLGPPTRGMIDGRALSRMRPGSWIVNTARGALIDEPALVEALSEGHLAGAGLDVFAHEPLSPQSPLLRQPTVIVTPHIAGSTRDAWIARTEAAWSNVHRIESGLPPLSRIE